MISEDEYDECKENLYGVIALDSDSDREQRQVQWNSHFGRNESVLALTILSSEGFEAASREDEQDDFCIVESEHTVVVSHVFNVLDNRGNLPIINWYNRVITLLASCLGLRANGVVVDSDEYDLTIDKERLVLQHLEHLHGVTTQVSELLQQAPFCFLDALPLLLDMLVYLTAIERDMNLTNQTSAILSNIFKLDGALKQYVLNFVKSPESNLLTLTQDFINSVSPLIQSLKQKRSLTAREQKQLSWYKNVSQAVIDQAAYHIQTRVAQDQSRQMIDSNVAACHALQRMSASMSPLPDWPIDIGLVACLQQLTKVLRKSLITPTVATIMNRCKNRVSNAGRLDFVPREYKNINVKLTMLFEHLSEVSYGHRGSPSPIGLFDAQHQLWISCLELPIFKEGADSLSGIAQVAGQIQGCIDEYAESKVENAGESKSDMPSEIVASGLPQGSFG